MTSENLVNIGSGNGLLPDCTPAIVDLLTYRPSGINSSVTFIEYPVKISIPNLCLKFTHSESQLHIIGDNQLNSTEICS